MTDKEGRINKNVIKVSTSITCLRVVQIFKIIVEEITLITFLLILPYFMYLVANILGAHTDLSWHNTPYLSCFVLSPFNPTLISTGPF